MAWFSDYGRVRRLTLFVGCVGVACTVLVTFQRTASATLQCNYRVMFYNDLRRVTGPVNTECTWPHSPPWGNWGVESGFGRRWDGFQFAGWKLKENWRQWNSCTGQYTAPQYFNDGPSSQRADPEQQHYYAVTHKETWPYLGTCRAVFTYYGLYMELWELDKFDRDDKIGRLYYPGIHFVTSCSQPGTCSGQSSWVSPRPGGRGGITDIATADIQVTASTY